MRWLLAMLLLATLAHGQVVHETDGIHHWPGRLWMGPEKCATADSRQGGHSDGTCAYFSDAVPGSAPMTCPCGAPPCGAICCHEHGIWDCFAAGAFCAVVGQACAQGADCCTGICIAGVCSSGGCTPGVCPTGGMCVEGLGGTPICLCLCGVCAGCAGSLCLCEDTTTTSTTTTSTTTTTHTTTTTSTTTTVSTTTTTGTGPTTTTTTTTTTTLSTTTTTTTSTTTTTTLPASVTFLWVPDVGESGGTGSFAGDSTLHCNAWVAPIGITNATTIVFDDSGGGSAGNLGVAIYNADGSSRITTTGGIAVTNAGAVRTTTTGSFNIVAGTEYQVCFCSTQASGGRDWVVARDLIGNTLTAIQQAFATPMSTTAATPCASGSPPVTTGVLNADGAGHAPLMLLLATDSP